MDLLDHTLSDKPDHTGFVLILICSTVAGVGIGSVLYLASMMDGPVRSLAVAIGLPVSAQVVDQVEEPNVITVIEQIPYDPNAKLPAEGGNEVQEPESPAADEQPAPIETASNEVVAPTPNPQPSAQTAQPSTNQNGRQESNQPGFTVNDGGAVRANTTYDPYD